MIRAGPASLTLASRTHAGDIIVKRLSMLTGGAAIVMLMAGCVAVPYGQPAYGAYGYDDYYGYGYAPGYAVAPAPVVTFGVSGGYYRGYRDGWRGGRGWGWRH
ncbi:hypothetical protein PNO31109_02453 [Pandoraea nosoerga]|uniref:Uncharacterized protein n=1 Tax=Pandoraea nosoerga TaxID=2508296 RepID=A0A5E4V9F2_9BURK|nr:hypothetical protein PNO31109_02453 [Pandoraea nosoerga]